MSLTFKYHEGDFREKQQKKQIQKRKQITLQIIAIMIQIIIKRIQMSTQI